MKRSYGFDSGLVLDLIRFVLDPWKEMGDKCNTTTMIGVGRLVVVVDLIYVVYGGWWWIRFDSI